MGEIQKPERKFLTSEQKEKIWTTINATQQTDDRDPEEVIRTTYNGDETAYLLKMAEWLNVQID